MNEIHAHIWLGALTNLIVDKQKLNGVKWPQNALFEWNLLVLKEWKFFKEHFFHRENHWYALERAIDWKVQMLFIRTADLAFR